MFDSDVGVELSTFLIDPQPELAAGPPVGARRTAAPGVETDLAGMDELPLGDGTPAVTEGAAAQLAAALQVGTGAATSTWTPPTW